MIIGNKIYHKKKIYNSLEWAKSEISKVSDGTIFLADIHEYTRGRQGRVWKFYPGQLCVTFVLKPFDPSAKPRITVNSDSRYLSSQEADFNLELNHLNMAISLGILEPLKKFGVGLKWPNDFMAQNKKVGGVLFEVVWQNNMPQGIVVGFAINVNNVIPKSDELYEIATSLKVSFGSNVDEKNLFTQLLESLNKFYQKWLNQEFAQIFETWKSEQIYLGKQIKIHKKDGSEISGLFYDVLKNGDLLLKHKSELQTIPFYIVESVEI